MAGGDRKYGRQKAKPAQKRYTNERRWIKNKARKIKRHMKKFPRYRPDNISDGVKALLK